MSDEQENQDVQALETRLREQWDIQVPPANVALTPINDNPPPDAQEINNRSEYIDHYTRLFNDANNTRLGIAARRVLLNAPFMLTSIGALYSTKDSSAISNLYEISSVLAASIGMGLWANHSFTRSAAKHGQKAREADKRIKEALNTPEKKYFPPEEILGNDELTKIAEANFKHHKDNEKSADSGIINYTYMGFALMLFATVAFDVYQNNKTNNPTPPKAGPKIELPVKELER